MESVTKSVTLKGPAQQLDIVLSELKSTKSVAADPVAVQKTITELETVRTNLINVCCTIYSCAFEVTNEAKYPVAV